MDSGTLGAGSKAKSEEEEVDPVFAFVSGTATVTQPTSVLLLVHREAAELGDPIAQYKLASAYALLKNKDKRAIAFLWFQKSAQQSTHLSCLFTVLVTACSPCV
jgi:hypothetical protein